MKRFLFLPPLFLLLLAFLMVRGHTARAQHTPPGGIYRGVSTAVQFDVSPPLRDITPLDINADNLVEIPERATGLEGAYGPQDNDPLVQSSNGPNLIPGPSVSFDGPSNIAGVSPPDPVGDVGPNHYVAMSNLYFAIYDKTGTILYGPAANNTLWAGFGGACQNENSGDPIVLHDQISDRWMLSQFTSAGPTYYNCVAVSTTSDPTGSYYRWAFSTGSNFPDYPKYGFWSDALYISTREFAGSSFAGIGAYAINRAQLIAGNPAPTVISFLATPASAGGAFNIGDGLLPTDLDGTTLPPVSSPNYFVGSMDNGGPYGAPQDALTIWEFHADFAVPSNSTFTLENTLSVAAFDSVYPCSPGSRDCIPQPGTTNKIDILSYRQRPMWRLAYRNFGTHESLVTNQSVEAAASLAGIRWYEIRDPNGAPTIYQQGTYAPGTTDGIHRWMGSIAMDLEGNMALGYSASDATSTFPSSWYTGRLVGDPLGTMPQGEESIIDGTGSQTGSQRWGDYTSMNVDPVDDCTFWYVNEYVPTSSSNSWRLRIGAFKFDECGEADFTISATPDSQAICAGADALYTVDIGSIQSFNDPVTLSASGNPAPSTANFSVNPVTPPGSSVLTIGNTGGVSTGSYSINVVGVAPTSTHTATVQLDVFAGVPGAPTLLTPADGSTGEPLQPTFTWNGTNSTSYLIEIATDPAFTNIVDSAVVAGTTYSPAAPLAQGTVYYWRVTGSNACGTGSVSTTFAFTTVGGGGSCTIGNWQTVASVNTGRSRSGLAYLASTGKFYLAGGEATGGNRNNPIEEYDPVSDTWTDRTTLLTGVSNSGAVGVGDYVYVPGGYTGTAGSADMQRFDPVANTVVTMTAMPAANYAHAVTALNDKVYVLGGSGTGVVGTTNYIYDIATDTWSTGAALPTAVNYPAAAADDNYVYVLGGTTTNLATVQRYNPTTNTWDTIADMTAGRGGPGAFFDGVNVWAVGGGWASYLTSTEYWDGVSWQVGPTMSVGVRTVGAAFGDGIALKAAGWSGSYQAAAETLTIDCPMPPVITVAPASLDSTQYPDTTVTQTLTISNTGTSDLLWSITEVNGLTPEGGGSSWADNFDSYATGSQMHGQGGWKGWDNTPGAGALTSDVQVRSGPNSVDINGGADLVHEYSGFTSGQWTYSTWQYIPSDSVGQAYFILLNTYSDGGTKNWSTQVCFDVTTNMLYDDIGASCSGATGLPIVYDQWVQIRVDIDLDTDTQTFYYNNQMLYQDTWSGHVSGGGALNIGAVDLFANGSTPVYYDDIFLTPQVVGSVCDSPADIPWASVSPTSGTTAPGGTSAVDVVLDSTGLAIGVYTGTLCVASNDPVTSLVETPVMLTVVEPPVYGVVVTAVPDALSGAPGETVTYTVHITNTGNTTDTFNLYASNNNGWTSSFSAASVTLGAGQSDQVMVMVQINAGATHGATNVTTVTAVSVNDPTAGVATVDLTTTANVPVEPGYAIYLPIILKP